MNTGILLSYIAVSLLFPGSRPSGQKSNYVKAYRDYAFAIKPYRIVDTGQNKCFDNWSEISEPAENEPFYGQDAQVAGNQPSYTDNTDGTVTDNITGLIWQKGYAVMTYEEAVEKVKKFNLAGRTDWRIPAIKEAYSLILFNGVDASSSGMTRKPENARPFVNKDYFDFEYGSNGDRVIDVQMLSATVYRGTTMGKTRTVFGVNLADGRIKGYPVKDPRGGYKKFTVRYVCGNPKYGINKFKDNGDSTISDLATGLMWEQNDSGQTMDWENALAYAVKKNSEKWLGFNDWRLPNAKELQSIVDYSRSPQETNSAAIDELFRVSEIVDEGGNHNYPFYWASTTHQNLQQGAYAVYVCFGEALGYWGPPGSLNKTIMDVHGAGAQRSDPKKGNPADYPQGRGPQGDVVRIYNYIRLVRNL